MGRRTKYRDSGRKLRARWRWQQYRFWIDLKFWRLCHWTLSTPLDKEAKSVHDGNAWPFFLKPHIALENAHVSSALPLCIRHNSYPQCYSYWVWGDIHPATSLTAPWDSQTLKNNTNTNTVTQIQPQCCLSMKDLHPSHAKAWNMTRTFHPMSQNETDINYLWSLRLRSGFSLWQFETKINSVNLESEAKKRLCFKHRKKEDNCTMHHFQRIATHVLCTIINCALVQV